jgi:hypothetical protein
MVPVFYFPLSSLTPSQPPPYYDRIRIIIWHYRKWVHEIRNNYHTHLRCEQPQPQFPRLIVISVSWTNVTEWSSANGGNGNATRGKTEKLNFQATEHVRSPHNCVAVWFPSVSSSVTRFSCRLLWCALTWPCLCVTSAWEDYAVALLEGKRMESCGGGGELFSWHGYCCINLTLRVNELASRPTSVAPSSSSTSCDLGGNVTCKHDTLYLCGRTESAVVSSYCLC